MIELRDYQKKAVRELKQKMIDMLNDSEDRQKLIFKAPTGAGKTQGLSPVRLCRLKTFAAVRLDCREFFLKNWIEQRKTNIRRVPT